MFLPLLLLSAITLCVNAVIEMHTLTATKRLLDIVVVAKEMPATENFPDAGPAAKLWSYHACYRTYKDQMDCPADTYWPYGVLVHLEQKDLLKLRLVNKLPKYSTNLHFHGLIVSAWYTNDFTKFADYSFVTSYNSEVTSEADANKVAVTFPMVLKKDFIDYEFEIPAKHPMGLYWAHPHNHAHNPNPGLSQDGNVEMLNQGLAFAMEIGNLNKYVSNIAKTPPTVLVLRSTFFHAGGAQLPGPFPNFCLHTDPLQGYCKGVGNTYDGAMGYFTLNNQVFPNLQVGPNGAIWRLINAMSNTVMQMSIMNKKTQKPIPFQVLWVDGTSLKASPGKMVESFFFMPATRIDIYVPPMDDDVEASLLGTGPTRGLDPTNLHPNVYLASVDFSNNVVNSKGKVKKEKPNPKRPVVRDSGDVLNSYKEKPVRDDINCDGFPGLAPGHRRRVTYASAGVAFQLGYVEIDSNGEPVNTTYAKPSVFDPHVITICAGLNTIEIWEIDNITPDDHNFHIHQTKFRVLSTPNIRPDFVFPEDYVDTVPLSPQSRTVVEIPFLVSGDFFWHCHITFHSDNGMMSRIRVAAARPTPKPVPTKKPTKEKKKK